MTSRNRTLLTTITTFIISAIVATFFVVWTNSSPSAAQTQTGTETASLPRTITVVGRGSVNIKPDIAQATIGVQVAQPDVKTASSEAEAMMQNILSAIQAQGIADQDIQTSGFNIFAERPFDGGEQTNDNAIYRVSNNVNVTIRDLDNVGEVLDAAIEAGANNIYGVNFSVDNSEPFESEARQQAMAQAQTKAQELATLANVQLSQVVSVSEVVGGNNVFSSPAALRAEGIGGGPISPGELEISTQLEIVYSIQ